MERKTKRKAKNKEENGDDVLKVLKSRKSEVRALVRRCFKNPIFSLVPFEIWRDILCEAENDAVLRISQTCWGFKELVVSLRELLLEYALKYRREEQTEKAKNHILRCAFLGDHTAMYYVGDALWGLGAWGLNSDLPKGAQWYKKSAFCGNPASMAIFALCLLRGGGRIKKDKELGKIWAKKALSSNNPLALAECHWEGIGIPRNVGKAFKFFKISAKEGNEFGQFGLGVCYETGLGVEANDEKAFCWYLKSAEQGHSQSQAFVGWFYRDGRGCEQNENLSKIWIQKAANQGRKENNDLE